jgi:hypothetical protein
MEKNPPKKIQKRFVIGMSPALILLILVTVSICLVYAFLGQ